MENSQKKQILLEKCSKWAENRLKTAKNVQNGIQESLLNETKSSAGDKHETGRAMLQIEREKAGKQLQEINKVIELLSRIDISKTSENVSLGSVVMTNQLNYFISVSAGEIKIEDIPFYAVSSDSPIGKILIGKSLGDEVDFRNRIIKITSLY